MRRVSRRDFLKYAGAGALGLFVPRAFGLRTGHRAMLSDSSDVVQCYAEDAVDNQGNINQTVAQAMMDASIKTLTGIGTLGEAWKSLFPGIAADSTVTIKVNCINRYLSTHPETATTIVNGLAQMQVGGGPFRKNNIIVWDRSNSELTNAHYTIYAGSDPDTVRYFGTNQSGVGYDTGSPLNVNGVTCSPSKIISQMTDYMINCAVLKDHGTARMTLTMKNHYGSINNLSPLHGNNCDPYIPSANQQIRDVLTPDNMQKLFIIDGLLGIYNGGPGGTPQFIPKLYIMSKDTVACDYQGQNVINVERQAQGRSPKYAEHITTAAGPPYDLGTTDINLIEITPTAVAEPDRVRPANGSIQVTPDPFRRSTVISFSVPHSEHVRLELVNGAGRTEATVFSGRLDRGRHEFRFNPDRKSASGTYFLKLHDRSGVRVRKVTVLN